MSRNANNSTIFPAPISPTTHSAISLTNVAMHRAVPDDIEDVRRDLASRDIDAGAIERSAASRYRFDGRFVRGADGNPIRIGGSRIGVPPINFLNRGVGAADAIKLILFIAASTCFVMALEYGSFVLIHGDAVAENAAKTMAETVGAIIGSSSIMSPSQI